ncbi:hypothetical protein GOBAR_DD18691 [Gossypium barbadense]|nr:hypothetical protein GOBAR_DD18691 [Gossypium barbadense]
MSISFIASVSKTRVLVQFRDWYLSIILLFLTLFVAISCCTVVFSFGYFLIVDITVECASALPMVLKFTTKPNAPLMLDRSFRLLPSYSVLTCSLRTLPVGKVKRLYGLGPVCNFLTKNEDVLEDGIPFNKTSGGATLSMIVSKYPTIKGINFDLPHVIENAPTCPGVEHVGGDMFASVPKGDAIFMKKCYEAVPDNGKMIVADSILPLDFSIAPCGLPTTVGKRGLKRNLRPWQQDLNHDF